MGGGGLGLKGHTPTSSGDPFPHVPVRSEAVASRPGPSQEVPSCTRTPAPGVPPRTLAQCTEGNWGK